MDIILYLLQLIQYQQKQICWFLNFICRYIPLKQWAFNDSHSPKYNKFKVDKLPVIKTFIRQDWQFLLEYYQWKYGKPVKPVQCRNGKSIPDDIVCPLCGALHHFIYDNNGGNGQYQCKVYGQTLTHGMPLCLTLHINLGLSLRKTSQALKDLYNISISHQQIANYCKTAAVCIKPFVDHYDYKTGSAFTTDETYIKVRGIKAYIWFIMDAASRSIIGYQVSDNCSVGPCILAMRMTFQHLSELPKNFKFIANGYSAYPLAAMEFAKKFKDNFRFSITQVIGLTNDDEVSKEFRSYKQMIERLNRTYKASYRPTNGFDNYDGANYDLALWVAYYNFLRPHKHNNYQILNKVDILSGADNMPSKWQLLIFLGQQTILNL